MAQTNTLFATDVVISMDNVTLLKVIVACIIIFLAFFLLKQTFAIA